MVWQARNHGPFEILLVLSVTLFTVPVYAVDGAERDQRSDRYVFSLAKFQLENKKSSQDLLQIAKAEADQELAALKAELSRGTQRRLASVTYDLELNADEVVSKSIETRVAAALASD